MAGELDILWRLSHVLCDNAQGVYNVSDGTVSEKPISSLFPNSDTVRGLTVICCIVGGMSFRWEVDVHLQSE